MLSPSDFNFNTPVLVYAFKLLFSTENEMDGTAIIQAFASCPGPDCLVSVITHAFGARVKVYTAIKAALKSDMEREKVRL